MLTRDTVDEVEKVLRSQGRLTKEQILDAWPMGEEDYKLLQDRLCAKGNIKRGAKGSGGLRVHERRLSPRAEPVDDDHAPSLLPAWERAAADRLAALLTHQELEELLGDLLYTVRQARKTRTGTDRRGSKAELARALMVQHGADVFADKGVRLTVAKALNLKPPLAWHSGKGSARRFVSDAEFPAELAGLPSPDSLPDFEYLEPRAELKALMDFQREVMGKLTARLNSQRGRGIVTLPTGAGKTRVAVETIREWMFAHRQGSGATCIIWLAHTEELCEQAYSCFRQVWESSYSAPPLWLFRFWGRYTKDVEKHRGSLAGILEQPSVLISTPARLRNLIVNARTEGELDLVSNLHRAMRVIVIDEAHRAAAPTYRQLLELFSADESKAAVIGLTATPFRKEYDPDDPEFGTRELREIFSGIIEPTDSLGDDPRARLIEDGILAQPVPVLIRTNTLLSAPQPERPEAPTEEEIERIDRVLRLKADNPARRSLVFESLCDVARAPEARILYFGPSVTDAEFMAYMLREAGFKAAALSARTRDVTRRRLIQEFRDGDYTVLCNCEVLTTGFDAPKVTHVVMARPTVSQVLYEQMVGRGLRGPKFGGTSHCHILDCEDNYKQGRPQLGYKAFRHLWIQDEEVLQRSA